jgi:hypothetical protein
MISGFDGDDWASLQLTIGQKKILKKWGEWYDEMVYRHNSYLYMVQPVQKKYQAESLCSSLLMVAPCAILGLLKDLDCPVAAAATDINNTTTVAAVSDTKWKVETFYTTLLYLQLHFGS